MNKAILLALMLLLMVAPTLAVDISHYYKYGDPLEIRRECYNNGDLCGATFGCSLSVYDPNSSLIINNVSMNNSNTFFNWTADGLWENGVYRSRMTCTDGSVSGSEVFYFQITPTGDDSGQRIFIILVTVSVVLTLLGFIFKNNYIGFAAGSAMMLTGIYTLIYGISGLADLYTRGIAFVLLALGLFFVISTAYTELEENQL